MKKPILRLSLYLIATAALNAHAAPQPDKKTMTPVMENHLKQNGDFCLGKFDWPIDVSEAEETQKTRDALQMPVLAKLGLVSLTNGASAIRKVGDSDIPVPVKRYELTETGKQYYLPKTAITGSIGKEITHQHDFCAGKFSLDQIVSLKPLNQKTDSPITTVTYTYHITTPDWARDADIQKVFPVLAKIINGDGKLQLQQNFKQEGKNWVAVNPWR